MRLTWSDYETLCRTPSDPELAPGWQQDRATLVAEMSRYLGMQNPLRVQRTTLDHRPAIMIVAPDRGGWAAAVVRPDVDLALLRLWAPTEARLRALWPTWRVIVGSTRLPGDGAVGPIRCGFADS